MLKRQIKRREIIRPSNSIFVPQPDSPYGQTESHEVKILADGCPPSPPPDPVQFVTPKRKRVIDIGSVETKKLKFEPTDTPDSPEFAEGLLTPASTPTAYSLAKSIFQRGTMGKSGIVGRDNERSTIKDFLYSRLASNSCSGRALYISGVPGTGKSALLGEVLDTMKRDHEKVDIRVANINCMVIERAELVFSRILHDLIGEESRPTPVTQTSISPETVERYIQELDTLFINTKSSTKYVVVLDELDHVVTKDQQVLFKIFQWAFMQQSSLILIGIANALDLTDRFLPRLRANNLTPQVLAFMPYTAEEVAHIVNAKLRSLVGDDEAHGPPPLMHPAAIQLCARKTAANTGDLRKAFDICKRAIEVVEEEVRRKYANVDDVSEVNSDCDSSYKQSIINGSKSYALTNLSIHQAPKVTVAHVARICSTAFGGSTVNRIKALNLQAKAVLCTLVVEERTLSTVVLGSGAPGTSAASSSLTIIKLFDKYAQVCSRERVLGGLQFNEFLEIITALEFAGVVSISGICGRKGLGSANGKKRTSRGGGGAGAGRTSLGGRDEYGQRRIVSNVHFMDLVTAVSDISLLKTFLN
jgi:cell division control protein 6